MLHSDANDKKNVSEGMPPPYQSHPQSPAGAEQDFYRDWTSPNQSVQLDAERPLGENYGPSAFPMQGNMGQNSIQSGRPDDPNLGDPRLGPDQMQLRQLPMWGTPPPNVSDNRLPSSSRGRGSCAIFALTLVLLLVFGVGLFSGWVFAHNGVMSYGPSALQTNSNSKATVPAINGNSGNLDAVREAVVNKVEPAVVQINVKTNNGAALGSGVIIDKRGYIVTNNHVLDGGQGQAVQIQNIEVVLADNSKYTAQITGTDPTDDLAVIKIKAPTDLVTATLGDSSQLRVGQEVLAIGNPLGITQTVTRGIISALGRTVSEKAAGAPTIPNAVQTDAPINPGNSGGALVDLQGNVIGIPTLAALDPEFNNQPANGVGFAIPSNRVDLIAQQLIQDGRVTHSGRAAMGVTGRTVNPTLASMAQLAVDHGVLIASVTNGGPAQRAGLQVNDVIVQVDNTQIDSLSTLQDTLLKKNPGDPISAKVFRGNQQLTVNLTLEELQF
jgi:S1-C subfamily serine protease